MAHQTIWKAGNSLVITITKPLARRAKLAFGSIVRTQLMRDGSIRLRPIDTAAETAARRKADCRPRLRRRSA